MSTKEAITVLVPEVASKIAAGEARKRLPPWSSDLP
jgi:hypothetical protein